MSELCKCLPPMLYGAELDEALTVLPPYDPNIIYEDAATRLVALSDIYRLFLSNAMSREIHSKLHLGLLRSLMKKESPLMPRQYVENQKAIQMVESSGIIGGADSFTIIGPSGIGKSTSISRSIQLLSKAPIIVTEKPYRQIIPCVMVQTPFDASVKGLLLEILRVVDSKLGSDYYNKAMMHRLFEFSQGNPSVLVGLLHDVQECSILSGREEISSDLLHAAYQTRLRMLHPHITPARKPSTSRVKQTVAIPKEESVEVPEQVSITALVKDAKRGQQDIVSCLKRHIPVEEVSL